jgi:hypothetical protein
VVGSGKFTNGHSGVTRGFNSLKTSSRKYGVKAGRNPLYIAEILTSIFPNDNRREVVAIRNVAADDEFGCAIEPMLLPGVGFSAGKVYRTRVFRDNTFEAESLYLFNERSQVGLEQRIQSQRVEMSADFIKHFFSCEVESVTSLAAEYVEDVIDNWPPRWFDDFAVPGSWRGRARPGPQFLHPGRGFLDSGFFRQM